MRKILIWIGLLLLAAPVYASSSNDLSAEEIISADELRQKQLANEPLVLFDARGQASYQQAHIEGAVLPFKEEAAGSVDREVALDKAMQAYPKETSFVTYCNSNCGASAALMHQLKNLGFKNVCAMTQGFQEWEKKGYPVVKAPPAAAPTAPVIPPPPAVAAPPCGEDTPCS